jgi:arylsulfatase A-like enzyme
VPAGTESSHLSGFQDYLPTFCELAGIDAPESDGISMLPTLLGQAGQRKHNHLYFEFYEAGGKQAIVTERWKAIRLDWNKNPDGPLELYDLNSDLSEQHNVASSKPQLLQKMRQHMSASHRAHEKN